ncbi:MAG: metallophosphoesterase family protein [Nocardioidaceae bacterium]
MGTYVVSDVHGHLADLRAHLARAGLVDAEDRWTGGDSSLWVLGDLVDRGPDGIGVIRMLRSLQDQAPDRVHVLMGNHEALMLGEWLFPGTRFDEVWLINGGRRSDQTSLSADDVAWLRGLPLMALVDGDLLLHSDTLAYLAWGRTVEEVNSTVATILAGDDFAAHFDVFADLTSRFEFAGSDGVRAAQAMLDTFGGRRIVHGHSIIGSLIDVPSSQVTEPIVYAEGLVVGIDGGRYDGGPLLLVQLS